MPACAKIRIFLENSNQYSTQLLSSTMSFQGKNVQWTNNVQWCTWFTFWCKLLILLWMVTDQLLCIVMLYSFLGFFSFVFFFGIPEFNSGSSCHISLVSFKPKQFWAFVFHYMNTEYWYFFKKSGQSKPSKDLSSSFFILRFRSCIFYFFFWAEKLKTITSFSAHHRGT